jgi:hypothetical protein
MANIMVWVLTFFWLFVTFRLYLIQNTVYSAEQESIKKAKRVSEQMNERNVAEGNLNLENSKIECSFWTKNNSEIRKLTKKEKKLLYSGYLDTWEYLVMKQRLDKNESLKKKNKKR